MTTPPNDKVSTTRTDAEEEESKLHNLDGMVPAYFARQLERELSALPSHEDIQRLVRVAELASEYVKAQRDELKSTTQEMTESCWDQQTFCEESLTPLLTELRTRKVIK